MKAENRLTAHATERISQRFGCRAAAAQRLVERAFRNGSGKEQFGSFERRYLQKREDKEDCIVRLYNGACFIFNKEGVCVTAYDVPGWFGKKRYFIGKERIRDCRKYLCRYNRGTVGCSREEEWEDSRTVNGSNCSALC